MLQDTICHSYMKCTPVQLYHRISEWLQALLLPVCLAMLYQRHWVYGWTCVVGPELHGYLTM